MSCHTWQKYDMNNKNKRFVWEADQLAPLVPNEKFYYMGYTVAAPWGKKSSSKKLSTPKLEESGETFTKYPVLFVFYLCVWLMKWKRHTFCFACSGEAKGERNNKQEIEKRPFQRRKTMYFQSLSWSHIKIPQVWWNMLPHKPTFVLLYSVCSYATLKTKS